MYILLLFGSVQLCSAGAIISILDSWVSTTPLFLILETTSGGQLEAKIAAIAGISAGRALSMDILDMVMSTKKRVTRYDLGCASD